MSPMSICEASPDRLPPFLIAKPLDAKELELFNVLLHTLANLPYFLYVCKNSQLRQHTPTKRPCMTHNVDLYWLLTK